MTTRAVWLTGCALAAAAGVATAVLLWARGDRSFVTHPVAATALGVAVVVVALLASRAPRPAGPAVTALAVAVLTYLLLGGWAVAAQAAVSAGLWSAGLLPVTALVSTVGLRAAGLRRTSAGFLGLSLAVALAGALLVRPAPPFEGVATVAPDAWTTPAPLAVDLLLAGWHLALVAVTLAAARVAVRASIVDRRRLARAAAVTSAGPCLVLVCLALAVLRDPGEVDPGTGSVAYTVAIGVVSVTAVWAIGTDHALALRLLIGLWAGALTVIGGVVLAGPVVERQVTVGVVGVAAITAAVAGMAAIGVTRFERWSQPPPPRPVATVLPLLSARENDVLAVVATGATNAAVAASLFLSERTVENHLRSIFTKLGLGEHGESNRRVRAAALWWEHQQAGRATGAITG